MPSSSDASNEVKAKAENVPGEQRVVADSLSRNPLSVQSSDTEEDVEAFVDAADIVPEDGRYRL